VSEPLVIVGNGMTAARLVDELTRYALARHAIGVIGDEQRLAYNRVLLSSVLAGETAPEDIKLKPMSWWRDRGWQYIHSGAQHPHFGKVLSSLIAENQGQRIQAALVTLQ
jgi:NAD(P)H-nitrite reductase large subunit